MALFTIHHSPFTIHAVMSDVVIRVENLWKEYRLGVFSHASMKNDLESWWARMRGKEDLKYKFVELT